MVMYGCCEALYNVLTTPIQSYTHGSRGVREWLTLQLVDKLPSLLNYSWPDYIT